MEEPGIGVTTNMGLSDFCTIRDFLLGVNFGCFAAMGTEGMMFRHTLQTMTGDSSGITPLQVIDWM